MKNQKQTIRKVVSFLNNPDEEGGFWLPNIQRPFVWGEDQICRLYDSILREYPISTLLIWKTTSAIRRRKFIDNWHAGLRLSDFYIPEDVNRKCLVLDGQQRLQSLFIGLMGSFDGKELAFDVLSGDLTAPDDVKYRFAFVLPARLRFPYVKFKDLVFTTRKKREIEDDIRQTAGRDLTDAERDRINENLDLIDRTFKMDETIVYQELDGIDNPDIYTEDDVVEVFIRANSGGTRLGKSDLLFSLLSSSWDQADQRMDELLDTLNAHGFEFDRDFVMKTCLVLLGQAARYEVQKFRKPGVREEIEQRWDEISAAIRDVVDFMRGKTFIQCDRALPTYLVLIPLVYVRFRYPQAWKTARDVDTYLLRCSLTGVFGGQPDTIIDALTREFDQIEGFDLDTAFGAIRDRGRSLELTEDRLLGMGYKSNTIHLLFNLWYRDFNHTPAYENNFPQIDHIFPQSLLKTAKDVNPETGYPRMRYTEPERNQLANCMLLTREENGQGGKGHTPPAQWFANKGPDYLKRHLIPVDPALWQLDRFDDFIAAREELILDHFAYLLVSQSRA